MDAHPPLLGLSIVVLLVAFLVIFLWRGMAGWLKKGLLCVVTGLLFASLGLFAPRKQYAEGATYLVTSESGRSPSAIQSGAALNKQENQGATGATIIGGLFVLGGIGVLVRRK